MGSEVKGIEPGMHVCVNSGLGYGAYAEYIAVPQKFVTVFPDAFPLKYAPGFLNYMVAYALLNEIGRGTDGKSIYIYGAAGGVGTAVIQTALLQGIEVIASAGSQEKCDYIKSLGAHCVFNHKEQDAKEVIMDYTKGRGVDLIFDQLVGKRFASQFEYLADFGMVWLTVTAGRKPKDEEIHLNGFDRWYTEIAAGTVIGIWLAGTIISGTLIANSSLGYSHAVVTVIVTCLICGTYTMAWFLIGYLSLIRRIKAGTLWKNSLIRKVLKWIGKCLNWDNPFNLFLKEVSHLD